MDNNVVYLENQNRVKVTKPIYDDEGNPNYIPTLKDIAIILYKMVGSGVRWQLVSEISKKMNLSDEKTKELNSAIMDIVYDYAEKISREDSEKLLHSYWIDYYNFERR